MVAMWWQPSGDDRRPGPQTLGAPRDLSVLERREATREEGLRTPSKQKEERTNEGRERERERHTHRGLGRAGRGDARVRTGPPTRNGPGAFARLRFHLPARPIPGSEKVPSRQFSAWPRNPGQMPTVAFDTVLK
jgi:hypothetical protein